MTNAPEAVSFIAQNGAELRFSLTNKQLLAIQRRDKAIKESPVPGIHQDADADNLAFLWETCENKGELKLKREDFIDLFPLADPEIIVGLATAIYAKWTSFYKGRPENEHLRPTKAATPPSDGSGSSDSGEPT